GMQPGRLSEESQARLQSANLVPRGSHMNQEYAFVIGEDVYTRDRTGSSTIKKKETRNGVVFYRVEPNLSYGNLPAGGDAAVNEHPWYPASELAPVRPGRPSRQKTAGHQ